MFQDDELCRRYLEERRILLRNCRHNMAQQQQATLMGADEEEQVLSSQEKTRGFNRASSMRNSSHPSKPNQHPHHKCAKSDTIHPSATTSSCQREKRMSGRRRPSRVAPRIMNTSALLLAIILISCSSLLAIGEADDGRSQSSPMAATSSATSQQVQQKEQQQPEPVALARTNDNSASNNNVILIKYANVSTNNDESSSTTTTSDDAGASELKIYQLNEPLTVSVIESKFAHSIELFDVSQNQLSTLSKDLFCPLSDKVRRLNVSHNLVDNFDCIGLISQAGQLCLSEVRVLDMSFNLIKHLPATGVATLHNLEVLNLSHNLIESLDELSLSSLFKLIKLDLAHNRLQQLPMKIFHKSSSMKMLKLQSNHLQSNINQQLLAGLISLEELNLSHNNISHVSDQAFIDKVNLTLVDLRFNQLQSLRQETLRVTLLKSTTTTTASSSSPPSGGVVYRHRLHHNGQLAGVAPAKQQQTLLHSLSASAEILVSSNPFACDCQLEWMRKFQPQAIKQSVLSNAPYGDHYQSDQAAPVITSDLLASSSSSNNNISEITPSHHQTANSGSGILHQPNQMVAHVNNAHHQQQHSSSQSHHYARIGDLNLIKCNPLLRRNAHRTSTSSSHHYRAAAAASGHLRALAPSDGSSSHKHQQQETMIDLLSADSSQFLCRYKSHCFALCQCCEFDACDCEMICPNGCNCYYDSTWQTNIIDCSANNHTVVPDRIPMDVSSLSLDGNNIASLKPSNLIARKSLRTLYLNSSNLQTIANRSFNGLIELQVLYLHDNLLRSLQGYEFEPLSQLKALYLQSNRLDYINNQSFIYLRSLEVLDLSNNRLTTTSLELFMSIGHDNIRLRQLSIAHNWWSCQCNSVNRFRQILRQKFPPSGGVNIVDKNQLRCYYNSTTVGPLILGPADGVASSSNGAPLYATAPYSAGNRQQQPQQQHYQQQQTQLTEINQCTEVIDKIQEIDINPPVIQANPPELTDSPADDYTNDPYKQNPQLEQQQSPIQGTPFNTQQPQYDQSYPSGSFGSEFPAATNSRFNNNNFNAGPNTNGSSGSNMSLPSLVLLTILFMAASIIAVSVFLFVRQQQHQSHHHKKSSAASTTSVSSNASSTAISSLNGKQNRHHHLQQQQRQQHPHHHQTMQHHQLIMSSGNGSATTTSVLNHHLQPVHHHSLHHHQHSASSQSNIYAALVSPTNGQSTTVTHHHHHNNLYSNSSTTASHHSTNSSHGIYPNNNQQQQQQHWQQSASIYNQPYGGGAMENHYTLNGGGQPSYKTGSLYNAVATSNCHEVVVPGHYHEQQLANDWIKLPKVKQFMSKLVNKSLALSGYKSCSRDELSAISTSDKIYDAFISYDKRDESFVMQHLSAELEYGQPQYRIADRFRDLPLPNSAYTEEAITSVIGCSHRTIIVLSKNYLQSDWCRYELQAALKETSLDKSHKIIAVVLDPKCLLEMDNEMRALLTHNSVLQTSSSIYHYGSAQASSNCGQLVQLDSSSCSPANDQQQQHLVATLLNQSGGNQQVSTQAAAAAAAATAGPLAQPATLSRITFINYNERKFWPKLKQLMPQARPSSSHALTLTTKN